MMIIGSYAQIRKFAYTVKDICIPYRMQLDDIEFFSCKFTLLVNDVFRNTDLTYVMKQRGIIYLVAFCLGLTAQLSDLT